MIKNAPYTLLIAIGIAMICVSLVVGIFDRSPVNFSLSLTKSGLPLLLDQRTGRMWVWHKSGEWLQLAPSPNSSDSKSKISLPAPEDLDKELGGN